MRIAVLGAGAVGTVFSYLLGAGGAEVVIYEVDPARRETLASEGLILEGALEGAARATLGEHGVPVAPFDLMLIAVPAFRTAEAVRKVSPFVHRDTYYLSAQDGFVLHELTGMVGTSRAASLICRLSAQLTEDGRVEVEEVREAVLATGEGFDPEIARPLLESLSSYVNVCLACGEEAQRELSRRAAISSAVNATCAVSGSSPSTLRKDKKAHGLVERACREALEALGLENEELDPFQEGVWDRLMPPMPIHLARYGKTEVDYLCGEILRRGRERVRALSVQRSLYTLVKELESGRLSPGEKALRELFRRVEEDEDLGFM